MQTRDKNLYKVSDGKTWWVKDEQKNTFGPAEWTTLVAWAADGRIGPSHQVSPDGKSWCPAADMQGLCMDWLAELAPGRFYGPIPREALSGLIQDGAIPPTATLYRKENTEAASLSQNLQDQLTSMKKKVDELIAEREADRKAFLTKEKTFSEKEKFFSEKEKAFSEKEKTLLSEREAEQTEAREREKKLREEKATAEVTAAKKLHQLQDDVDKALRKAETNERMVLILTVQLTAQCQRATALEQDTEKGKTDAAETKRKLKEARTEEETLRKKLRDTQYRLDAVKKDLEETQRKLDAAEKKTEDPPVEILEAEVLPPEEPIPPPQVPQTPPPRQTKKRSSSKSGNSLAELEAQARRELAALQAAGRVPNFFKK